METSPDPKKTEEQDDLLKKTSKNSEQTAQTEQTTDSVSGTDPTRIPLEPDVTGKVDENNTE